MTYEFHNWAKTNFNGHFLKLYSFLFAMITVWLESVIGANKTVDSQVHQHSILIKVTFPFVWGFGVLGQN